MTLNENADIDTSQVTDARGSGGGGGGSLGGLGGLPIPIGGGTVGTLIVLALIVAGTFLGPKLMGGGDEAGGPGVDQTCSTANPDRLNQSECRNALYINSIQAYWRTALPTTFGEQYQQVDTVFFARQVNTGCGMADSGVGPFYCPLDDQVYIDLTFYDELAQRFGAKGRFAQPYVLAHEYGHHVQDLLGTSDDVQRRSEADPGSANELSVRLELQADCFAGVWAKHALETKDAKGQPIFSSLTQADIDQALEAAAAIGDDKIQSQAGGPIDESKFTHGTSEQRSRWFNTGYGSGDGKQCDTFTKAI
ncbi:KPN_02809 family neutral zinc metallopeptidase [Catellatospora tritici]|uniref:KPN_02809 family neutral zinc metallopeptidase n=1 Tax=Catellatospora tritici TaxID=2851566 RepID=UPI001C2CD9FB|nr:neutral zinc metallopeptidase [Catellatospora tritici]MBV1849317.1 neutral zinc metallopeptidase [Catellatospora tritici]